MTMLWNQHRDRYTVGDHIARPIPYLAFKDFTREITAEEWAIIGRLNAKRQSGDTLTEEEAAKLQAIAVKWPQDDLRGACLVPPMTGEEVRALLATLPRSQSEDLEAILDRCATPDIPADDLQDPLVIQLLARGGLGIDIADMTVGQGMAIIQMLTPREG